MAAQEEERDPVSHDGGPEMEDLGDDSAPIIFDEGEYAELRRGYNPGVDKIPHDLL